MFEQCILQRYCDFLTSSDNQFGFKKKSGCVHAIYALKCTADYYVSHNSTVNLCALDLSKAFDKMNHHALFLKLMKNHIPVSLLRLLEIWFESSSTCVKWGNCFSDFFKLTCGIRQSGVLSPHLFAVYIDSVIEKIRASEYGCVINWAKVGILVYADDILLLAPSVHSLQNLLRICEVELQLLDMTINPYPAKVGPMDPVMHLPVSYSKTVFGKNAKKLEFVIGLLSNNLRSQQSICHV